MKLDNAEVWLLRCHSYCFLCSICAKFFPEIFAICRSESAWLNRDKANEHLTIENENKH